MKYDVQLENNFLLSLLEIELCKTGEQFRVAIYRKYRYPIQMKIEFLKQFVSHSIVIIWNCRMLLFCDSSKLRYKRNEFPFFK